MSKNDVTGRDAAIIHKALAYAIVTIDRLPEEWREASDRRDMETLLRARAPKDADFYLTAARGHIERRGVQVDAAGKLVPADRDDTNNVVKLD